MSKLGALCEWEPFLTTGQSNEENYGVLLPVPQ